MNETTYKVIEIPNLFEDGEDAVISLPKLREHYLKGDQKEKKFMKDCVDDLIKEVKKNSKLNNTLSDMADVGSIKIVGSTPKDAVKQCSERRLKYDTALEELGKLQIEIKYIEKKK